MVTPQLGTSLTKRCKRCGMQVPLGEPHSCSSPSVEITTEPQARQVGETTQPSGEGGEADQLVGAVLGERYQILTRLSQGGMGVVYKAKHVHLDTLVAVKILLQPQDPVAQRRFLEEAKMASLVKHPNTVYIADFGLLADGRTYLVMELLSGPTLAQTIADGAMDPLRACKIAQQIATGLQAVHDHGVVHRDLKPDKITPVERCGNKFP